MPFRRFVLLVAVLAAAGCTSSSAHQRVNGSGSSSASAPTSLSPSSSQAANSTSAATSVSVPPPFRPYLRTPAATVIGDPATADLCAAIGLGAFAGLGVTASFEPNQFPPGCIVDLMKGGKAEASISMYGTRDPPNTSDPTRTESGLTVYVARFDPSYGDCERDIATDGLTFKIQAVGTSTTVRRAIDCGGTNAMTKSLAAAVAAKRVPRIALASPSVTLLNMCAVVRASKLSSLPVLAGAKLTGQAFGIDCEVTAPRAALFFNTIFDSGARPQHTNLVTIGGHRMFANRANRASLCSFISVQGTTSDGRHEEISAASNADDNKHPPAAMCTQTSRALSMVLDTAGLH